MGSLEGVRRKAVTVCFLLRHAARAAEPTRPGGCYQYMAALE